MHKPVIWLINPYAVPPEYPASTRHYELAKELDKHGFSVVVWACCFIHVIKEYVDHRAKGCFSFYCEKLPFATWNWLWSTSYKKNDKYRIISMIVFSAHLLVKGLFCSPKPDVIIGSSPHMFGALSCMLLAKLRGSKFIFEVRDLWPDTLFDMKPHTSKITKKVFLRLESILYKYADAIVPLTPGIEQRLILDKHVNKEKVQLVPNGIAIDTFRETNLEEINEFKKLLNLEEKIVVTYAGAHGQANALDTIVTCAEMLKNEKKIIFLLAGDGQERPKLVNIVEEKMLQNIKLLGPLCKQRLGVLLEVSDICLLTLKDINVFKTALPNKIFDYMFFNKPIIAAVNGDVAEFITNNNLGYSVEPENPEALARKIKEIVMEGKFHQKGTRGKEFVLKRFTRESTAASLVKCINKLIYKVKE
ncbi:glycosyltransferase family 4 protein [Desulfotomaculum defluvii]